MTTAYASTTTLAAIRAASPCEEGWRKLLGVLGKTSADDEPLDLLTVLDSNGLDDALWVLSYAMPDDRLARHFQAWCAEQVLHLFEAERPDDARVRDQIAMLRNDEADDAARKAARKAGATKASWNEDSKELKVTYAANKTSSAKIQEAIAKKGYDTQDLTGDDKAYDNLHSCCKYDRKGSVAEAPKKCCDEATCKMDPKSCKDNKACADKGCCKSAGMDKDGAKKCCASADGKMKCGTGMSSCKHDQVSADAKKCCDEANCGMDPKACKASKSCAGKDCCKSS